VLSPTTLITSACGRAAAPADAARIEDFREPERTGTWILHVAFSIVLATIFTLRLWGTIWMITAAIVLTTIIPCLRVIAIRTECVAFEGWVLSAVFEHAESTILHNTLRQSKVATFTPTFVP